MLTVKVWCLPKIPQRQLQELHKGIVAAVASVKETEVHSERDMLSLFPADMMSYGLGQEILVEINGVPEKMYASGSSDAKWELAAAVGKAVEVMFPNAHINSNVLSDNPEGAFWSSN